MLNFGPSSLFFTSDNIDSGGEEIYGVEKEWNNKWIKCLLKAHVLNKCQLLLSLIVWNMYLCFPARFLTLLNFCAMTLLYGPNWLFINNNLQSFVLICSTRRVKCLKRMSLLNLVLPHAFLISCPVERKSFVLWQEPTPCKQGLRLTFRQINWTECKKGKRNSAKFNF